jgi:hypothetical protein
VALDRAALTCAIEVPAEHVQLTPEPVQADHAETDNAGNNAKYLTSNELSPTRLNDLTNVGTLKSKHSAI